MPKVAPLHPIYIPSAGRAGQSSKSSTPDALLTDGVPFRLVVEPQEAEAYADRYGTERILVLPFRDAGQVLPARNWIKDFSTAAGESHHWQLDDNIRYYGRRYKGRRLRCDANIALRAVEDFVDRYTNIAVAGHNYYMFVPDQQRYPAFTLNCHVYSSMLFDNSLPFRFRTTNEDTDYCLQSLAAGYCTVQVNVFLAQKVTSMAVKGGNTAFYQGGGKIQRARELERLWPGVVSVRRRFRHSQHVINWQKFDTPLKLKPGIDLKALKPNEYGLKLIQVTPEIKSSRLRKLLSDEATK